MFCGACQEETQTVSSCCEIVAPTSFAKFASDKNFQGKHENPLPYTHESAVGKEISFKASDGKEAYAYELKAKKKTNNYLFVFHEWWGLNDHIKREAERFYTDLGNVNVVAIDLYDKKIADTREKAAEYMGAAKPERCKAIIEGALKYAGKKAKITTVGWCFGGGWSLQASLVVGKNASGCIVYYGMPEKDIERLKTLNTEVLGIFASQEQWISPKIVSEFEQNMKTAGKKLTVKNYDADHAFANPSNPKFNKEFAEDAYQNSLAFLKARLQ